MSTPIARLRRLFEQLFLQLLRRSAIRYRLIISFILLSLLPLLISGYLAYVESSKAIKNQTRVLATEVVKQVSKNVQLQMMRLEVESERMVLSDRFQLALGDYNDGNDRAKGAARLELTRVLLERYGSFDFINQKYVLDRANRVVDSQVFAQLGGKVEHFVVQAPDLRGRPYWGSYDDGTGQNSMVMLRAINSKNNNKLIGNLFLGIRPSHFSSIFDDVALGTGTDTFIFDGRSRKAIVRAHEQVAGAVDISAEAALAELIARALPTAETGNFAAFNSKALGQYLAAYARVPGTSWFVVSTIPLDKLTAEAKAVRNQIVLIGLLCFLFSIALALVIARSIAAPLERLVHGMRETETGNYAVRMNADGSDELTVLTNKFNEMASRVDQHNEQLEARVRERTHALEDANSKLAALSLTDSLTGIANRRRFDEALAVELKRAARARIPLALMMIDVDFFKNYNDFYGHQEGDSCLRRVARLLQAHARRASDLVARYGGEEFVMIAADTDYDSAQALAESMRATLAALQMEHERSPLACVTISIGVVTLVPDEDLTPEALVRMADKAMYRAKEQGRDQVVMAGRKAVV